VGRGQRDPVTLTIGVCENFSKNNEDSRRVAETAFFQNRNPPRFRAELVATGFLREVRYDHLANPLQGHLGRQRAIKRRAPRTREPAEVHGMEYVKGYPTSRTLDQMSNARLVVRVERLNVVHTPAFVAVEADHHRSVRASPLPDLASAHAESTKQSLSKSHQTQDGASVEGRQTITCHRVPSWARIVVQDTCVKQNT
jgi:hypothetical protein